jgi:uncharacterized protein YeaO (DUF488 family)
LSDYAVKRIYEPAEASDGYRVLVDRLWPRGVSKERAALDEWAKDLAPSSGLREWFGHVPERFPEFAKRYVDELEHNPVLQTYLNEWQKHSVVTLLYGARDEENNEALVLKNFLESRSQQTSTEFGAA